MAISVAGLFEISVGRLPGAALPSRGTASEVSGIFAATWFRNTVRDRSTVTPGGREEAVMRQQCRAPSPNRAPAHSRTDRQGRKTVRKREAERQSAAVDATFQAIG